MTIFPLKPNSTYVKAYYATLKQLHDQGHVTEGNTRAAFETLLRRCASPYDWTVVPEYQFKGTAKQPLRADGALVDSLTLVHGLWEAKDSADDLQKEIKSKVAKGYPLTNILFQSPTHAVLYQDSRIALDCDLTEPENLVEVLQLFFDHRQAHEVDWEEAVFKFSEKIPDLAQGVTSILEAEHKKNADFREKFQSFADLCRQSINPDLKDPAIQKMLVQHLLTERIFRKVFNNQEFLSRNVIAAEIEKVIHSITAKHFSRDTFLKPLDRFYTAIEKAAEQQEGYTEKQHFLNAVYEKFFQSFDKKQADTHGIVYTPQPIVDFMVRSVEEILKSEFGKSLSDEGVHILDPFTGTGNFITRIMQQIKKSRMPQKYAHELHCNEVMLLPYYIASMNIEHAYSEAVGEYRPFEGICLVNTFELAEGRQISLFTAENTERVKVQKNSEITVIIANPPYRGSRKNESEGDKNQKYPVLDERIADTYIKDSAAQLLNKARDPYIRALRWASDRIAKQGIVCFVTNNAFLEAHSLDGLRKHLILDFDRVIHLNLKGNAHSSAERRRREGGNVFEEGSQSSIGITFLLKGSSSSEARLQIYSVPDHLQAQAKLDLLSEFGSISKVPLESQIPDITHSWVTVGLSEDFPAFLPLGIKVTGDRAVNSIFEDFSLGVGTNRDEYAYAQSSADLKRRMQISVRAYGESLSRYKDVQPERPEPDVFVDNEDPRIKWTRATKANLKALRSLAFNSNDLRVAMYRPFYKRTLAFSKDWVEQRYRQHKLFPTALSPNVCICVNDVQHRSPLSAMATDCIPDLHISAGSDGFQAFPFYFYDEDGTNRRENITDWALAQYRGHYQSQTITKWDIFHSTYALLHHPEYRTRYAANLKRELPRIPFPPDLHAFAAAGKRLMELHIDYEKQPEYPLEEIEQPGKPWTLRVEKMSLSKDKTDLRYNEALTLRGIPPAAFDYRLGNRSALEWVIDQYRVSTDPRSGIVNDPNREDDPNYILRLIKQVITVSLETQQIIATLPSLNFPF